MENQTQSAKELKAELKSIASKIATVKKQAEAKTDTVITANENVAPESEKAVFEAAIADVKDVATKANAKAVKAAKTVVSSPETVQVSSEAKDDTYCVMSVLLENKTKLKVIRKNGIFYLVNQSTNVFGINTDIISEHADKALAVRALAKKLSDWACQ